MHCLRNTILLSPLLAFLVIACITSDSHAGCIACWELKGVIVRLKNGTTIEGYAKWNDFWAELGHTASSYNSSGGDENTLKQALENMKQFPDVIFDPKAQIDEITVYTHLRSIKYPVPNALVRLRDPVWVKVEDIKDLKLNPGPHDGYDGAGSLPLVSDRVAELLQTKPSAICHFDVGVADRYCISYDKNFPEKELQGLCNEQHRDEKTWDILKSRDIFCLDWAYD